MKRFSYSKFEDTRKYNDEYFDLKDISKENECPYHDPCSFDDDYLVANRDDRQVILHRIREHPSQLEFASVELQADKEVVLTAVNQTGYALQFSSVELRADKEVVLTAVNKNGLALDYASDELCADRNIILEAVRENGDALEYANCFSLTKDIFFQAIDKQRHIEKCQTSTEKDLVTSDYEFNKDIALAAVTSAGSALEFVGTGFQNNKEVVLTAVNQVGYALQFASDELQGDKEVVLAAVNQLGYALRFASVELQADKEVVLVAVNNDGQALLFASDELQADKEVVLAAVNKDGQALQFASDELQADKEVVISAVFESPPAIEYASDDIYVPLFTKADSRMMAKIYFEWTYDCARRDEFAKSLSLYGRLMKAIFYFKHDKDFVLNLLDLIYFEPVIGAGQSKRLLVRQFDIIAPMFEYVVKDPSVTAKLKNMFENYESIFETTHVDSDSDNYNPLRLRGQNLMGYKHL